MPTDPYAGISTPVSTPANDPYAGISTPVSKPAPQDSGFQPTKWGFGVKQGEAPTGGPALIRDDGAINFPGQSNWLFYDPESKQYAPAPSEPWKNKGFLSRNLGSDALSENARNFGIGTNRAVQGGLQLIQRAIPAGWQPADQAQTDQEAQQYQQQQEAAINATQQASAKKYQTFGQMAPAAAVAGLAPGLGASAALFGVGSAVSEPGDLTHRAVTGAEQGGLAYVGGQAIEKLAVPVAATFGNYLASKFPWLGNASRATAEALGLPTTSETPWADAFKPKTATPVATEYLEHLQKTGTTQLPSEIAAATKPETGSITSVRDAVKGIRDTVTKNVEDIPYSPGELPKIAADPANPYAGRAQGILDAAEDAARGGDPTKILSSEVDMGLLKKKLAANAVKDVRDGLAADLKGPYRNLATAIDDRISFLKSDISTDHSAEIKGLELFRARALGPQSADSLALTQTGKAPVVIRNGSPVEPTTGPAPLVSDNGTRPVVGGGGSTEVRDAYGTVIKPAEAPVPMGQGPASPGTPNAPAPSFGQGPSAPAPHPTPTFANGTAARSTISDDLRSIYKGGDTITGTKDVPTLLKMKKAIDLDRDAMALASGKPQIVELTNQYNKMYSDYSRLATDRDIIRLIKEPDPDKLRSFLATATSSDAQKYLSLAGPKGQAAYAQIAVENAFQKAVNPRTGSFLAGNAAAGAEKGSGLLDVTVQDPALRTKINSLTTVLQGLAKSNPAQASSLGESLASSAASFDRTGLASAVLNKDWRGKFIDWAFNSPEGKDFLFRVKGLPPDSPTLDKMIAQDAPKILQGTK